MNKYFVKKYFETLFLILFLIKILKKFSIYIIKSMISYFFSMHFIQCNSSTITYCHP